MGAGPQVLGPSSAALLDTLTGNGIRQLLVEVPGFKSAPVSHIGATGASCATQWYWPNCSALLS